MFNDVGSFCGVLCFSLPTLLCHFLGWLFVQYPVLVLDERQSEFYQLVPKKSAVSFTALFLRLRHCTLLYNKQRYYTSVHFVTTMLVYFAVLQWEKSLWFKVQ